MNKLMRKFMHILIVAVIFTAMYNVVFADDVLTSFEDDKDSVSVTADVANECREISSDDENTDADDSFALYEYGNGITIISDSSTISKENGTLTLTAEIENPLEGEGVIWSIESGKSYATIAQSGVLTAVTNGTVVVKATSTVDSSRFGYKTIVISIVKEDVSVFLDVTAQYANIQNTTVDGTVQMWFDSKAATYPQGTKFKLEAVKKNGMDSQFMYWWDLTTSRIVSFDPVYEFILGTETKLQAVYAYSSSGSKFVLFKDINNKILAQGYTSATIKVPSDPYTMGYDFLCWVSNGNMYDLEPRSALDKSNIDKHTVFTAGYIKNSAKYTVTIVGANNAGGEYLYNDFIQVTPVEAPEKKRFAYWKRDGKIVSYDNEYSFYVGNFDTTVEAVFVGKDEIVAEIPIIVMSEPQVVDTNKISFVAERNLPSQYELVETGIILSSSKSDIDLDTSGIIKVKASSTANKGQFTVRKKDVSSTAVWFARGYMIYKDGDSVLTIYSDAVSKSL